MRGYIGWAMRIRSSSDALRSTHSPYSVCSQARHMVRDWRYHCLPPGTAFGPNLTAAAASAIRTSAQTKAPGAELSASRTEVVDNFSHARGYPNGIFDGELITTGEVRARLSRRPERRPWVCLRQCAARLSVQYRCSSESRRHKASHRTHRRSLTQPWT